MSKRASLILAIIPALLFGVLLFLSQTMAVSGGELANSDFSLPEMPLLQGGNESEPNDTVDTADPIAVNLTMRGVISENNKSDLDWYILNLPPADLGRDFRASLEELDPDPDYRLELNLYDSEGDLIDSQSSGSATTLDWTSSVITYYLRVRASDYSDLETKDLFYGLTVLRFDQPTPTPTPIPWDSCEVNDDINGTWSDTTPPGGPCQLAVGIEVENLNFIPYSGQPTPNDDFFTFLAKAGRTYRITADVAGGADTHMWLYDPSNAQIAYDDDGGTGLGSSIERTLGDGWYKVLVRDRLGSTSPPASQTYDILVEDVTAVTPTPAPGTTTPTRTPGPSVPGAPDKYEPNYWFDRATLIGLDETITANFVPAVGADPEDTDFYKLWVVSGKLYTCETSQLGSATNTNIIFCSGPSQEQCFAGNDDVQPFDPADPYRSRLKFFSTYNGYLYLMLGQVGGDRVLPEEWQNLSYNLKCYIEQPGTATPTPTSEFVPPTSTPRPTATSDLATSAPPPTATPAQLVVRPMIVPTPPPTAEPDTSPAATTYDIEVLLYYDRNQNKQPDADEGVAAVLARAHDALSGELLSLEYTDETGRLRLSGPAGGPVRVSVPFFGFNQVITTATANIQIRISPRP